jgi:hypothetical protein
MDQVFEGTPRAEIYLEERRIVRGEVSNDWGSRLQWRVSRDGKVVAVAPARGSDSYEHPDTTPGAYEVVLEMWKYEGFKAKEHGQFVEVSNKVRYII